MKAAGGGIIFFLWLGDSSLLEAQRRAYPSDFNAYLRIGPDGRVGFFSGKIEMGQGIVTSLPQMLADELDVTLDTVDITMGDTSICVWDAGTWGSLSTRQFGPYVRAAGAEARGVMIELASERLKVPKERLATNQGVVFDTKDNTKRVTYGQLAQGKVIDRHLEPKPNLKPVSEWKVMGVPTKRVDSVEKVTGKAIYTGDIRLEGMLYAKILRPPAHRAVMKNLDTSEAEKTPGVIVVRDGDLVAVLGKNPDEALAARRKIKVEWDVPKLDVNDKTIFDHIVKNASAGRARPVGDLAAGEKQADTVFEHTYLDNYKAHAPMEPHTAVAQVEGDKITVWASTQSPFGLQSQLMRTLGFSEENVRVITPFLGGGFGGKSSSQQAIEAARLAKASGKPVMVAWTRQEEFFYDTFRPAAVMKVKSGVTNDGKITLWDYGVYMTGTRGAEVYYDIPNHQIVSYSGREAEVFATGPWRAPGNPSNTFARESQIDIMAARVGMDPVEFRLKNLTENRIIRTIKAVAEKFGWKPAKSPSGRGYGMATGFDAETYVALIVEVEVDKRTGAVQVKRMVAAQDMGQVVNPQGATLQMEGCLIMGLGYALTEDLRFKGTEILDVNFNTYKLPTFSMVPKIETVLVKADELPPTGGGEPPIIGVGGAIANAIFDATGARLFQQPFTPERVKAAHAALE